MSENDIVPELLEKIINDFEENVSLIRAEETFEALLKSNNLEDAYEIAREIGGALSESFSKFITEDILPNGRMYYNIANRIIPPSLQKAYNEAEKFTEVIMSNILSKSKIGIKVQQGLLNQDRIRGIVDRLSEAENYQNVKFLTGKAVVQNVTQSAVDDTIEANAEFHYKSGLRARVERKLGGKCCAWCQKLVGKYTYPDVPEDVYRRHENCRCTVIYYPSKANRGQDVWSKKVIDTKQLNKSTASNNMASNNKTALWKPKNKDNILSPEQYKDLMSYARSKNIELSGFKSFDGDVKTIKTAIDNASAIANKYPKITSGKRKLTLMLDDLMDDADFATTKGHIIHLNANAFRDAKTLEREYQKW